MLTKQSENKARLLMAKCKQLTLELEALEERLRGLKEKNREYERVCYDLRGENSRMAKENEMLNDQRTHLIINIKSIDNSLVETEDLVLRLKEKEAVLKSGIS